MISQHFLDDSLRQFRKLKSQADKALAQTKDEHLFLTLDDGSNSIAIIMKHMAGNMRSRWTDFLTTDGEKPDRERDSEFEISSADDAARLLAAWEDGWARVFAAIGALVRTTSRRRSTSAARRTPCSRPSTGRRRTTRRTWGRSCCSRSTSRAPAGRP